MFLIMINKRRWDNIPPAWLLKGDIQADPLGDLHPKDGSLSVWLVDDQLTNLDTIIVGLALTRQKFDLFEYGLFDSSIPEKLSVNLSTSDGQTPLPEINQFHRNLIELNIDKYAELIRQIFPQILKNRILVSDLKNKTIDARDRGLIDSTRLNGSIRRDYEAL